MRAAGALLTLVAVFGTALAFYEGGDVVVLNPGNIKAKLSAPALVEFYAPWCGHCKSLKPDWERAAQALKGLLTVAAVDADAYRELGSEFGVRGFPTIKFLYTDASGKVTAVDYQGGRSAKEIVEWGLEQAQRLALGRLGVQAGGPRGGGGSCGSGGSGGGGDGAGFYAGTDVASLTDDNFHQQVVDGEELWFVEFYAPWCGHCQALKPAWTELARTLKGRVRVGAVDCTEHKQTCQEFQVQGYPTIKFFGERKDEPQDYSGGRDAASLAQFATQQWAAQQPPPEVRELADEHTWEEHCTGHPEDGELRVAEVRPRQLCLVAFLPHILDSKAAGRQAYLQVLRGLTAKYKDRPFSYLWAEGGAQPDLEANFGVGGYGYPALIAFNPSKGKYASLRSAFEEKHVQQFLESVRLGFESVADVSGALARVATRDAWDGGDGQEVVEEEFDLADLMGEEVGEEEAQQEL